MTKIIQTLFMALFLMMSQYSGLCAAETKENSDLLRYVQREPMTLVLFNGPILNPSERKYVDYVPEASFLKMDSIRTVPFLFPEIDLFANTTLKRCLFVSYKYYPAFDGLQILDFDQEGIKAIEKYLHQRGDHSYYEGKNLYQFKVEGMDQFWDHQAHRLNSKVFAVIEAPNRLVVSTSTSYIFQQAAQKSQLPTFKKSSPLSAINADFFRLAKPETIAAYRKFSKQDTYQDTNICKHVQYLGFVRCGHLSEPPYTLTIETRRDTPTGANMVKNLFTEEFTGKRLFKSAPFLYGVEFSTSDPVHFYNSLHLILGYGYYRANF
ncbi:MAG TPA: hypothetical protein PKC98_00215 [Candidatus Melainabacteria bacterium]|nr:hypothetical protein [Candidatus Melainabacteria bacterium]